MRRRMQPRTGRFNNGTMPPQPGQDDKNYPNPNYRRHRCWGYYPRYPWYDGYYDYDYDYGYDYDSDYDMYDYYIYDMAFKSGFKQGLEYKGEWPKVPEEPLPEPVPPMPEEPSVMKK